jgi:nicotinate-nucleotide adenylyltransferase
MKIGIFGGSFDPIHIGHLMLANYCVQFAALDQVWLMVSPCNPLKQNSRKASQEDRLKMCKLAVANSDNILASDFEFSLPRPSYTYKTLKALKEKYPEHEFFLIIGADNWLIFDQWRDTDKITEEFHVIIYPRPGYTIYEDNLPENVSIIKDENAPLALISSTFIRNSFAKGYNSHFCTPEAVEDYIIKNRIYGK